MRTCVSWTVTGGMIAALALAGCGGDSKESAPANAPASGTSTPAASTAAAAPPSNRCPLTAMHVTVAIGTPMNGPDSACGFSPVNDKLLPRVLFVLQNPEACRPDMLQELNLKEKTEVLGVPAYMGTDAEGTHLLACRTGERPFDIVVDTGDVEKNRSTAITLAVRVLGKTEGL
jgi:hypothetical protein